MKGEQFMKIFSVKNIRNINDMSIKLSNTGITTIVGNSGSGKTTFAKLFTIFFNSIVNDDNLAKDILRYIIIRNIRRIVWDYSGKVDNSEKNIKLWINSEDFFQKYYNNMEIFKSDLRLFLQEYNIEFSTDDEYELLFIDFVRNVSTEFKEVKNKYLQNYIQKKCNETFFGELNNSNITGNVSLSISAKKVNCEIVNNSISNFTKHKVRTNERVVYFGDFNIFNSVNLFTEKNNNYIWFSIKDLVISSFSDEIGEILWEEKTNNIIKKINKVFPSNFSEIHNEDNALYCNYINKNNFKKRIRIENLSEQEKVFLFLKTAIQKGIINNNSILVFDGMDKYCDQDIKKSLAEIIALIQKELSNNIVVTTKDNQFNELVKSECKKSKILCETKLL